MSITLCAMLYAVEGRESDLVAYEDTVLALIPEHGGTVVSRFRNAGDEGAYEVQVITLPDEAALASYLADPRRVALTNAHRSSIARTDVLRVTTVV
jgi:hypothetical protein